ncbi:hypothetical protein BCR42DRAFT_376579 [Absidia repens]|uniref:Kinase n=1 Tax=Absidia repens TaxID=90262 RepID=A0A1X2IF76_9FUNG|nr:hypothetical protein BCR42DRAFT_376579 [Absidia repens]
MESVNKLVKFESQVAGHDNILCLTTNDLMVFKPSSQQEREFYEASQQHEEFMDWIPECYGTLRSSTENEKELLDKGQDVAPVLSDNITDIPTDQLANLDDILFLCVCVCHLCLENILHGFTRPCIMDIKLGYKIYEDTADEAKRNKMIKNAQGTTIESLGLRISGMKIFDSVERHYTSYTKQYGRERTKDNFLDGLLSYFYPTYNLNNESNNNKWILEHFIDTVSDIQGFVEEHAELQLVGCSLLLVYEGDASAAQAAWKRMLEEDRQDDANIDKPVNDNDGVSGGADDAADADDDADAIQKDMEETGPKLCDIRLIDFGRSRWQPGRTEQEQSFIKALDNLMGLLDQVIEQSP